MINIVVEKLSLLDLKLNSKKCFFIRIGKAFFHNCCPILIDGCSIQPSTAVQYFGVSFKSTRTFKIDISHNVTKFYRALSSLLSKFKGKIDETIIVYLVQSQCNPILFYWCEIFASKMSDVKHVDFVWFRFLFSLWGVTSDNAAYITETLGLKLPSSTI